MKTNAVSTRLKSILFVIALLPAVLFSQAVYNVNFQDVNFGGPGVTIVNKVGDGKSAGNVVLYQNVITIGGQAIDAVIRTVSLTPSTVVDYFDRNGTGSGYTNNQDDWFSPQLTFPTGGGQAMFKIEFILGGSYNNATNQGTAVILENVQINTYDIDGNGNPGSNQFSEFGGFSSSELATSTVISPTYNASTGLTKFQSTTSGNVTNASDPSTRIRVTYAQMSSFSIQVGSGSSGQAYFFLEFGTGISWSSTVVTASSPTLDLNTTTAGNNNSSTFCSTPTPFTAGSTNITPVLTTASGGTTLDQLSVGITSSELLNGASEKILISGATAGGTIPLNFTNGAVIPNVTLSGKTYAVAAVVGGGESVLAFSRSSGVAMTIAEAEALIDALSYTNVAASPTNGIRDFEVKVKDGAYESQAYHYSVTIAMPVISLQPQNTTVSAGGNLVFSVNSSATSYQWQVDPNTGVYGNVINSSVYSGATTNQLTVYGATSQMNNYKYRVLASNVSCAILSANSTLAVSVVLPVNWIVFTSAKEGQRIRLDWTTSAEHLSKAFIVQRSADGRNFVDIGTVAATGESAGPRQYSFSDQTPLQGKNYYRIAQKDQDDRISLSKTVSTDLSSDRAAISILSNPVLNGQLTVRADRPVALMLFSHEGILLQKKMALAGVHRFDLNSYPKGMYTLVANQQAMKIVYSR